MKNEHMKQYPKRPQISSSTLAQALQAEAEKDKMFLDVSSDFWDEVVDAFFYTWGDGYEVSLVLIRKHDVSRDEMEWLDCVDSIHRNLLKKATSGWVKDNGVEPPVNIGDTVSIHQPYRGKLVGKVHEFYLDEAKAIIKVEGERGMPIVTYEELILCQQ